MRYYEEIAVGDTVALGSHAFTAEAIVEFASQWDPQTFHLDAEAARTGPFGALCASGWHTACAYMRLLAGRVVEANAEYAAAGKRAPGFGPSPGFRDLAWKKPVYAGDTVTYTLAVADKRTLASRPGWGLITTRSEGVNQAGEAVFEITSLIFVEMRQGAEAG